MTEKQIVRVRSAPGLHWKKREGGRFEARWQCRDDLVKRPDFMKFKIKSVKLWSGTGDPTLEEWDFIADTCGQLQQEMSIWANGGVLANTSFDGTIAGLIRCYKTDPDSNFRKRSDRGGLRYGSRVHYDALMKMLETEYGAEEVAKIKGRTIQHWYDDWSLKSLSTAHAKIKMLRTLFSFGTAFLEDANCARISATLSKMKFKMPPARNERLTAEQAIAIRAKAWEMERPSIALAQAFQFELMLRQKDVIGEWVPLAEPGMSDILDGTGLKWQRGIRWEEIDQNHVLIHVTSKRDKKITVNLMNSPMIMEELALLTMRPASGPIVVSEFDKLPWTKEEFRRWWRKCADGCGIPKAVKNMDSRAGAITEASDAGADLEHIRHAATHSNISMTQRYSRGAEGKIAQVQKIRVESRNKSRTE